MSEAMKLLPCPFCGSIEVQAYWKPDEDGLDDTKYWGAGCKRCVGMIEEGFSTKEKAVKAWNTRHPHIPDTKGPIVKDWQRGAVKRLKDKGLSHADAMNALGEICEQRQRAYMDGYNRAYTACDGTGLKEVRNDK